jgi:hypothetical protein
MDGLGPVRLSRMNLFFISRGKDACGPYKLVNQKRRLYYVDDASHTTERIDPVYYLGADYYQLWLHSAETLLMERECSRSKKSMTKYGRSPPKSALNQG